MSRLPRLLVSLAAALSLVNAQTARKKAVPAPPKTPAAVAPAKRAPNSAAAPAQYPIEAIRITGSKLYDEATVAGATGLHPGDPIDEAKIQAASDRLLASGAFTNVSFRYAPSPSQKGYLLTFEVVDLEQLFDYRFDRLEADDAKLRAYLKEREPLFGGRIPGAATVVARFSAAIADYLRSQNKPADVNGRVATDAGQPFVLFSPPGQMPAVATVTFTGNKVIPLVQLQSTIHPVAVGSQFREARFRELLDLGIRPLYEARGRLQVKFTKVEAKPSPDAVKGLAVTVAIDEGESFSFGPTRITGVGDEEGALIKAAALTEGEVADMQLVTAAQSRIERFMRSHGRMAVASTVERGFDGTSRFCNITFHVTPGPEYHFGKLTIQGLDLHGEAEMRRIWTMKSGETYNGDYPDLFVNRVKEEQLFDGLQNAHAVATPNHKALTVDVKLVFNERKPKILQ